MSYTTPVSAVLDSGSTKTVCGSLRLDIYVETLSAVNRQKVLKRERKGKEIYLEIMKQ